MTAHLTRSAEQALVTRTRSGDRAAASQLLASLDGLLRRAAWRYRDAGHGLGVGLDDYIQEARIEVVAACQDYDPARAALFRTYALTRVRHRLFRMRRDSARRAELEDEAVGAVEATDPASAEAQLAAAQLDAAVARALASALAAVAGRERRIVRARLVTLHTGVERGSLRDVGEREGCSHQHVRDVEAGALAAMRARLGSCSP